MTRVDRAREDRRRFQFGHLPPGGALGGLRWSQLGMLVAGGIWIVAALNLMTGPAAAIAGPLGALMCAAAALVPVWGRTVAEWAPVAAVHVARRVAGRTRFRVVNRGSRLANSAEPPELPSHLAGTRVVGIPAGGAEVGAVVDGDALVVVLVVDSAPFVLLDDAEKDRRVTGWGQVLAGLGRAGSPVERVQWIERTAAQSGDALGEYLADEIALPTSHRSVGSYLALVDDAVPVNREHEVLIALRVGGRRARRLARRAGGGTTGMARIAVREAAALVQQLSAGEVGVAGALTPGLLARAIRLGFDPLALAASDRARPEGDTGIPGSQLGPTATEEGWGAYRADGAIHVTYWVAEWPRTEVGADVLMPLLLTDRSRRSVSVVMEPLDPARALREAENAGTQQAADDDLRERAGFANTAKRRRQRQSISRREAELADGHAAFRFAGYVTVSAASEAELEEACASVEHAAQMARCELRRLWGEQEIAFTATLPLCRGLR